MKLNLCRMLHHTRDRAASTQLRGSQCYRLRYRWCLDGI